MNDLSDLCRGCEEQALMGQLYHPECCPHEHVESIDEGSGDGWDAPVHDWSHVCHDCGANLIPEGENEWGLL